MEGSGEDRYSLLSLFEVLQQKRTLETYYKTNMDDITLETIPINFDN